MKTIYSVEICYINRPFGLKPKIKVRYFLCKKCADRYAKKFKNHPNKFVYARWADEKEMEI